MARPQKDGRQRRDSRSPRDDRGEDADLIDKLVGIAVMSQPDFVVIQDELGYALPNGVRPDNLIDQMMVPNPDPTEPQADTRGIAKGVCGAILGSAATLVQ